MSRLSQDPDEAGSSYQPLDPIISSNFSPFSPSVSRARPCSSQQDVRYSTLRPGGPERDVGGSSEATPLLFTDSGPKHAKKPFYRPRPLWLVPFGLIASVVRGMTLAPRVQVFTQLSCNALYGHDVYDHTSTFPTNTTTLPVHVSFYSSLDPYGPHPYDYNSPFSRSNSDSITFMGRETGADDDEPDPRTIPSKRCLTDSKVQVGAARIQTVMTTTMGLLSALTTGWWGHFGERHGRTRVLAASTLGLLLTDLTFILVSTPHSPFSAHGHKLLILSPIIEGLLGGWSTLQGATSAYVSDCTSDGSRAKIFSRFSGVFYLGFSVGPVIGAFLIRHPLFTLPSSSGRPANVRNGLPTVTSTFYIAALCSFINLLLVLFVFPESINKKKKGNNLLSSVSEPAVESHQTVAAVKQGLFQSVFSPLALFAPKRIQKPDGRYEHDYSLTILGTALFMFLLATGIFQIKYLYAEHVYEWGAEKLSYYITFVGAVRAVHLLFFMPYLISTFKPKAKPRPAQPQASTHDGVTQQPEMTNNGQSKKPKPTLAQLTKEINFDLLVLRLSFLVECLSHTLVSVMPSTAGQDLFVGFTTLSCFGAGVVPAVNSLALCIMQLQSQASSPITTDGDSGAGRLFGAMASLQAVGQMILGPLIFGIIYSSTVGSFPKAIFATAAGIIVVALLFLCLLRPDVALRVRQQRRARRDEETERGRSRVSKDLGKAVLIQSTQSSASESSHDAYIS